MASYFVILLLIFVLVLALVFIYSTVKKPGRKVVSMREDEKSILTVPASVLVEKLRNGEFRSEQIVETYIARIKDVNSLINAVVEERFDAALEEAREIDRRLENLTQLEKDELFDKRVLYGVPFTCKEAFGCKGLRQTSGLVRRQDNVANENAEVVQKLFDAGAILLGTTNVSELCMWWESANRVYGRTKNPYDSERMAGGSSGGEAAIIAAAGSLIGIGSDLGGSIRMPAFFNGIFGHKPSPSLISNSGQFPVSLTELGELVIGTGPLCRYAADLTLLLKVMSTDAEFTRRLDANVDISKLKFYSITKCGQLASSVCLELLNAQESVCDFLNKRFEVPVAKFELPLLKRALLIWSTKISMLGGPTFGELLFDGLDGANGFWEFFKWCLGQSDCTLPAIGLAAIESVTKRFVPKVFEEQELKNGENLRLEIESILGADGVLLFPSHPTTALRHNIPILKWANFVYTAIFNALHLPVTQVPLGLDSKGLPMGIQVVAARNNDHLTIAVAEVLEKEFGGWVKH